MTTAVSHVFLFWYKSLLLLLLSSVHSGIICATCFVYYVYFIIDESLPLSNPPVHCNMIYETPYTRPSAQGSSSDSFHSTDSSFDLAFAVRISVRVKITGWSLESIWVSRGIAPRIFNFGIGWKWAVSFTFWPPHPEGRDHRFSSIRRLDVPQSQRSLLTLSSE